MAPHPDLPGLLAGGELEEAARVARSGDAVLELADLLPDVAARTRFLDVDLPFVRLLEDLLDEPEVTADPARSARLLGKLAFELRGDPTTLDRRADLLTRARELAATSGDRSVIGAVALTRVTSIDEDLTAGERLAGCDEAIALLRRTTRTDLEAEARLQRFHALLDGGSVLEAELELGRYERLGGSSPHVRAFVDSRRSMLALLRGCFDDATELADRAVVAAHEAGMPDAGSMGLMLHGTISIDRGDDPSALDDAVEELERAAQTLPGHLWWALLARIEVVRGDEAAARAALARARPELRSVPSTRWIAAVSSLAHAAAAVGSSEQVAEVHAALLPHDGRIGVLGPAIIGTVGHALAALEVRMGAAEAAIDHARAAVAVYDDMAALVWGARARCALADALDLGGPSTEADRLRASAAAIVADLGARWPAATSSSTGPAVSTWSLIRDGAGWTLRTDAGERHLPPARGFDALAMLLVRPGREIEAIVLDGGDPSAASRGVPVLDEAARKAYLARLMELDGQLDRADDAGDAAAGRRIADERAALVEELRRATGLGGRARFTGSDAERARVNVTRNLKRAVEHVARADPEVAAHLTASLRTGSVCRYEPAAGGPAGWTVDAGR